MDGEQALGFGKDFFPAPAVLQIDRHQGRLPVVAVDQIGVEFQGLAERVHRPAEKAEAFQVVEVIPLGGAVKLAAGEKFLPGDEIERGSRRRPGS